MKHNKAAIGFQLWSLIHKTTLDYGPWTMDCRQTTKKLWAVDHGLWTMNCRLSTVGHSLRTETLDYFAEPAPVVGQGVVDSRGQARPADVKLRGLQQAGETKDPVTPC